MSTEPDIWRFSNYTFERWFQDVEWRINNRRKEIDRLNAEILAIEGEKQALQKVLKEELIP